MSATLDLVPPNIGLQPTAASEMLRAAAAEAARWADKQASHHRNGMAAGGSCRAPQAGKRRQRMNHYRGNLEMWLSLIPSSPRKVRSLFRPRSARGSGSVQGRFWNGTISTVKSWCGRQAATRPRTFIGPYFRGAPGPAH